MSNDHYYQNKSLKRQGDPKGSFCFAIIYTEVNIGNWLKNYTKWYFDPECEEGGSGTSWQTVFEGSVTTEYDEVDRANSGTVEGLTSLTADTIKVTFDGVEYTCPKLPDDSYGAPLNGQDFDFSEYPFNVLYVEGEGGYIVTETAGTYSLKIEEPQSGGSSDFTTAEVTLDNTFGADSLYFGSAAIVDNELIYTDIEVESGETATTTVLLYKGKSMEVYPINGYAFTGNVSYDSEKEVYYITGDATIQTVMYHITINSVPIEGQNIFLPYNQDTYIPVINGEAQSESYDLDLTNGLNDFVFDVIVLDNTNPYYIRMNAAEGITHTETGAIQFVDDDGWLFNITGDGSITLS